MKFMAPKILNKNIIVLLFCHIEINSWKLIKLQTKMTEWLTSSVL